MARHRYNGRRAGPDDDDGQGRDERDGRDERSEQAEPSIYSYGARRRVGRPSGITPQIIDMVYEALLTGADQVEVARALNIGNSTFYYWMQQGRKQREAVERGDTVSNDLYLQFLDAVEQAQAMFVVRGFAAINAAAVRSPNTILELIGRRYPARYGPTSKRPMSADDIMEALDNLPDDEYNRLFANYAARGLASPTISEGDADSGPADDTAAS